MAEYYGYFNGIEYGESFVALVNRTLVKTGVFFDGLSCSGNSMNVVVSAGSANLNGFLYNNDSALSLEVETAHATLPRIDAVMIRHDISSRRINAVIVKGTAQSNPSAPSPVRNASYYDLKIADVLIPGGASSVSTITDTRGDADVCGLVTGYDTADLATITNRLTSLEARDYIVEQGISGIWTYRKWNSGIAECWGKQSETVDITTAFGNMYRTQSVSIMSNYPNGLFNAPPILTYSVESNVSVIATPNDTLGTSTSTQSVQILRPTSRASTNVTIYWIAKGQWK